MMKLPSKGYLAPWSHRREAVGLMGTFMVFLLGMPGRSEPMIDSVKHMAAQLVTLLLVFLGLSHPVSQEPVAAVKPAQAVVAAKRKVPPVVKAPSAPDRNSMRLQLDPPLFHFVYIFEGKAMWKG